MLWNCKKGIITVEWINLCKVLGFWCRESAHSVQAMNIIPSISKMLFRSDCLWKYYLKAGIFKNELPLVYWTWHLCLAVCDGPLRPLEWGFLIWKVAGACESKHCGGTVDCKSGRTLFQGWEWVIFTNSYSCGVQNKEVYLVGIGFAVPCVRWIQDWAARFSGMLVILLFPGWTWAKNFQIGLPPSNHVALC